MPHWPTPESPASTRARDQFVTDFGHDSPQVAAAPSTIPISGEYVDYYGGTVIVGLGAPRAAVAVAPSAGAEFTVHFRRIDGTTLTDTATVAEVADLANAEAENPDDAGSTPPRASLALRLGGIAHTMIQRHLLPRDTAGLDVTVISDIPAGPALGEDEAIDAAFALALQSDAEDAAAAPLRARLAEVCAQSAEVFSPRPLTRARFSAALRGTAGSLAVIDYADDSVMQAPLPDAPAFALLVPDAKIIDDGERRRRAFFQHACRAFGTDSLRSLPDARSRVLDWLRAVHKVHQDSPAPRVDEAATWLGYVEKETDRSQSVALALRSRRLEEVWPLLGTSHMETAALTGSDDSLVQLALGRGALTARSAGAAGAGGAFAFVPAAKAANFAADLADDGLTVVPLGRGSVAEISLV